MSDVQSPEFNALRPPTVDQPTFTPPVTDPFASPTATAPLPWGSVPPPPPGADKTRKVGRNILIGLAVLVGLGVIGAAGSADKDSTVTAAGGTPDTTTTTTSYFSRVTSPIGSSSSPSTTSSVPSSYSAMVDWIASYGTDDTDAITDGLQAVADSAGDYDLLGMKSGCRALKRTLTTAQSHLPIPEASVDGPYSDALRYYQLAIDACISGDLTTSSTYLGLGGSAMERATSAMKSYNARF